MGWIEQLPMVPGQTYFSIECTNCGQHKRQTQSAQMISAILPGGQRSEHYACKECAELLRKHNLEYSKRIDKANAIRERFWVAYREAYKTGAELPSPPTAEEIDAEIDGKPVPVKLALAPEPQPDASDKVSSALDKLANALSNIDDRLKALEGNEPAKPRRTTKAKPRGR